MALLESWRLECVMYEGDAPSLLQIRTPKAPIDAAVEADTSLDTPEESAYVLHRRFDRLGRLYGDSAVERLMGARIAILGVGGVGSYAAEALARSAVGSLTLIDFDRVCVTNVNRQVQALRGTIGKLKVEVLAERLKLIHPKMEINAEAVFYEDMTSQALLFGTESQDEAARFDLVLDCIDNLTAKAHLLATCRKHKIPVISAMGAAGKRDPGQITRADLAATHGCPMAKQMRRILRQKYDFPETATFDIPAVFSPEPRSWPRKLAYDKGEGFRCVCPHKSDQHSCDGRGLIDGTAVFVTGSMGLHCAGLAVEMLVGDEVAKAEADNSHKIRSAAGAL